MSTGVQALAFSTGITNCLFFTQVPVFRRFLGQCSRSQLQPAGTGLLLTQRQFTVLTQFKFVDLDAPPFSQHVPLPHPTTAHKLAKDGNGAVPKCAEDCPKKTPFQL